MGNKKLLIFGLFLLLYGCSSYTENPEDAGDYELMDRANNLYEEKKYQEAYELFEVLQRRHPQDPFYLVEMGHYKAKMGDDAQSVVLFQKALALEPDNPDLINKVAIALMYAKKYKESSKLFQQVLQKGFNPADAWANLGYIAMQRHRYTEAERDFQEALKIDPKHTTTLIRLGNLKILQHQFDKANQIFMGLKKSDPDNPDVIRGIEEEEKLQKELKASGISEGLSEPNENDPEHIGADVTGIELESKYIEIDPSADSQNVTKFLLDLAKIYRKDKNPLQGLEVNLHAYALDPDSEETGVQLGYGYLALGQVTQAKEEFEKVLEVFPNSIEAILGLAEVSHAVGDDETAEFLNSFALQQVPQNSNALEQKGRLLLSQKRYDEAAKQYKILALYDPNNPNVEKGLLSIEEAPYLEKLGKTEKSHDHTKAEQAYEQLLRSSPENIEYLTGLADVRSHQKRYPEAVKLYRKATELEPHQDTLWVSLGHAYLDNKQYQEAQAAFHVVLDRNPLNVDALLGDGAAFQSEKNYAQAERQYDKALGLVPKREDALGYMAELRLAQKRYHEAEVIFKDLSMRHPEDDWFKNGLMRARTQPWIDRAQQALKQKDYEQTMEIGEYLISLYPEEADLYIFLAQVYSAQEWYDCAIDLLLTVYENHPTDKRILKALGFTYLEKSFKIDMIDGDLAWSDRFPFVAYDPKVNASAAHYYLREALEQETEDSEIYAGLGKVAEIYGCKESAEAFYEIALSMNPKDTTALAYYGEMLKDQKRFFYATAVLGYESYLLPDADYAYKAYRDAFKSTRPSAGVRGFYHQENQWDHIQHRKAARLQIYGGDVSTIYPVNEDLKVSALVVQEFDVLKDYLNHRTSYAINVQRAAAGFEYNYCPNLFVFGKFGVVYADQFRHSFYPTQTKWLIQPALGIKYSRWNHTLTAETLSIANIVEQDFNNPRSKLFSGQGIQGTYEYDFGKRRVFGCICNNFWYNDWIHNQSQYGAVWAQWCPDQYWENIAFRYQFSLGRFNQLTQDYYTYQAQTTHTLSIILTKSFLDGDLFTTLGYSYSWQRSFESGQQLVVAPIGIFHFLHRRINYVYGQLDWKVTPCLDFTFFGDYSKETYDYEIWNVTAKLDWSF